MSSGEEGIVHKAVQVVSETAKTVSTKTGEAWDASKEAGIKVADAAEETCEKVKHAVTSDSGTGVIVEDRSVE
jgi:hypothetical protein